MWVIQLMSCSNLLYKRRSGIALFLDIALRIFLIFFALIAGFAAGNLAAQDKGGFRLLGRQATPVIESTNDYFQLRVTGRVIIRVPRLQSASTGAGGNAAARQRKFSEKKAKKCYSMTQILGFRDSMDKNESLELLARDGSLIRAYLGDGCLAREFYAGAYVDRASDGNICEDRDVIHARTGAQCEIEKFRLMVAK